MVGVGGLSSVIFHPNLCFLGIQNTGHLLDFFGFDSIIVQIPDDGIFVFNFCAFIY